MATKDKRYFNPSVDMNMFVIDCLNNRTCVTCQITCRICQSSRLGNIKNTQVKLKQALWKKRYQVYFYRFLNCNKKGIVIR